MGIRYKANQDLLQLLDDHAYLEEETVTLKVPLVLPYRIDLDEYERVDGEIEHEGEFYRLVKQKLENDTLYIVCYKDRESKEIKQVLTDYVKTFTDKPVDTKQQTKSFSGFIKDYIPTHTAIESSTSGWHLLMSLCRVLQREYNRPISINSPPPKA